MVMFSAVNGFATGCALVQYIVSMYFINLRSVLITYDSTNLSTYREGYLSCLEDTFHKSDFTLLHWIDIASLAPNQLDEIFLLNIELGVEGHITVLPSTYKFLPVRYFATENSILRLKDKRILFLTDDESPRKLLKQEMLQSYPFHLMVSPIISGNLDNFNLWTQKFTSPDGQLHPLHLGTFHANESLARNVELYPNKVANLEGRIIKVAAITYVPYVISNFVESGEGNVDSIFPDMPTKNVLYEGSEAALVWSFCELRNCTLQVIPFGQDEWGGINTNGSSDGMIGAIYRGVAEFGIGCYYNWYNDVFETSVVVAKSAVRLVGPAPLLYPAYMTNILPFSHKLWCMIILSIIIASLVMHIIKFASDKFNVWANCRKFRHMNSYVQSLLEMFAIFLQQAFPQRKLICSASRFFLTTLLLAGITLENSYSGQLKSLLTVPIFTDPVDTVNKFAGTNWKWGAPADAWVLTISKSDISYEQEMTKKFEIRGYEELRNLSFSGRYGLTVERLHSGMYSFGDYIKNGSSDMILFKDDLFFDWTRGFAVRGWPLMDAFNMHVMWCSAHGLFKHWERKYVSKYLDRGTQQRLMIAAAGHFHKPPPMALAVVNISGPLFALFIGYSLAFAVFISELAISGLKKCIFRKCYTLLW